MCTEFNYRGWEPEAPREDGSFAPRPTLMGWHPDGVPGPGGTLEARAARVPYGPPDLLSTFTYAPKIPLSPCPEMIQPRLCLCTPACRYLTDVDESTPAFAVIPKSRRIANIQVLKDKLGDEYGETPIYGKAGTCCIVDRLTIHTRLDPVHEDPEKGRRIYHHVFARVRLLDLLVT